MVAVGTRVGKSSRTTARPWDFILAALIALIPVIVKLVFYADYPGSDDSFIHLDVAHNILAGHGWGLLSDRPVNLSSSPLYTVLLLVLLPIGGVGLAQVVSGACAVAALFVVYLTARRLTGSEPLALTALAVGATNVQLWRWTGTVMETTLGVLAAALIVFALSARPDWTWTRAGSIGVLIGVSTLVRFELGMLLVIGCALAWAQTRDWRPVGQLAGGFAVAVATWVVFSIACFGSPIPTTFGAKASALSAVNVSVTKDALSVFGSGYGPALLLLLGAVALLVVRGRTTTLGETLNRNSILYLWPLALFAFYYVKTADLQSPGRYFLPGMVTLPVLAVAVVGAVELPSAARRVALGATAAVSLAVALALNTLTVAPILDGFNTNYRTAMIETAAFLRDTCSTGPVLVVVDVGIVAGEGVGGCGPVVDSGTLANPELRGLTLEQKVAVVRPSHIVQSIGTRPDEWAGRFPDAELVFSRPYASHGLTTAGAQDWVNIYRLDR